MEAPAVTVNGETVPLAGATPHTTALDWLRARGLTGGKEGCAEGECGACSILVARPGAAARTEWTAINACLVPAAALDGQEVVTAEGLGTPDALHPVQREMAVRGGSQCGYCTPGLRVQHGRRVLPAPDRDAATATSGRGRRRTSTGPTASTCTRSAATCAAAPGYRPIRDAAYALGAARRRRRRWPRARAAAPPAPPPTRLDGRRRRVRPARRPRRGARSCSPSTPTRSLVAGSTDWGVEVNIRGAAPPFVVAIDRLPELRALEVDEDEIEIGAALSLSEVERRLDGRVPLLAEVFPQFASRLIRNGATIGGNLGTGVADRRHPAGPARAGRRRRAGLAPTGDREVAAGRLLHRLPADRPAARRADPRGPDPAAAGQVTAFHKIAKRRFDDISSVAVGFALDVADGVVRRARIGLGGVAATPIRALATEAALEGRPWTAETVRGGRRGDAPRRARRWTTTAPARLPRGDARAGPAQAVRRDRERPTGGGSMSALSERPANAVVGPADPARERRAARHRRGALHRRPRRPRTKDVLHAYPVQAPHAHARITAPRHRAGARRARASSGCSPPPTCRASTTPASSTTSRCSPTRSCSTGTRSAGCSARRSRPPGSAPLAVEVDYEPLPSLVDRARGDRGRRASRVASRTWSAATSRPGSRRASHVFSGEFEFAGQEHFYLETHCCAGAGRRERADLRPEQHPAPVRDAGDRRPRARPAQPRGHRAVPADGRRLRRQGDAAARVRRRSPRSARPSPAGRCGCGSTAPRT